MCHRFTNQNPYISSSVLVDKRLCRAKCSRTSSLSFDFITISRTACKFEPAVKGVHYGFRYHHIQPYLLHHHDHHDLKFHRQRPVLHHDRPSLRSRGPRRFRPFENGRCDSASTLPNLHDAIDSGRGKDW